MSQDTSPAATLHVVCPHCHTTNRVRADQLVAAPDCGSCHQPLFAGQPLALAPEAAAPVEPAPLAEEEVRAEHAASPLVDDKQDEG